jgi:hypothetical protein
MQLPTLASTSRGPEPTQWSSLLLNLDYIPLFFLLFFLWYWGLNSGPTPWATPPALVCEGFFWDRVSWTICPGWLQTTILLISAFWVARLTDISHWYLASLGFYKPPV